MIGCLWTPVRKQPIIVLYFESVTVLKFYNLEASSLYHVQMIAKLERILVMHNDTRALHGTPTDSDNGRNIKNNESTKNSRTTALEQTAA